MIIYDGISLEAVADVKIEDVLVNSIDYEPLARSRPIRAGAEFVRNKKGTRTIIVSFAILEQDPVIRERAIRAVSEWAKTDKEYKIELSDYPDVYLTGVCTKKPDISIRQWWQSNLQLVFACFNDPFWNSKSEKSVACGSDFVVLGDAEPLMRIERTLSSSASNQSYTLNGNTITFSTIPAGDLVIDLDAQTAVVGNTDIMQYYNVNSKFLIPKTGPQKVTGTGTVKYRERWQ